MLKIFQGIIVVLVGIYTLNEFMYNFDLNKNKYLAMIRHPYFYYKNKGRYSIKELRGKSE